GTADGARLAPPYPLAGRCERAAREGVLTVEFGTSAGERAYEEPGKRPFAGRCAHRLQSFREAQREAAAPAELAPVQLDPAGVTGGQLPADVETEAGPRDLPHLPLGTAHEAVEYPVLELRRDPKAAILDPGDPDPIFRPGED